MSSTCYASGMQNSDHEKAFDVVVVGAGMLATTQAEQAPPCNYSPAIPGVSGIIAAQRYLQAHPNCRLTILEQDYCIGGVWSERETVAIQEPALTDHCL